MFRVFLTLLTLTFAQGQLFASVLPVSASKAACCGMGHCAAAQSCCRQGSSKSGSVPVVPPQVESGKWVAASSLVAVNSCFDHHSVTFRLAVPVLHTQGPPLFVIHNSFLI